MLWFLRDIDLLTILARAATLSFEALLLGGIAYLFAVAKPASASWAVESFCRKGVEMAALALIAAELVMVSAGGFVLVSGSGLSLEDVFTTNFFRVDCFAIVFAIGLCISARFKSSKATVVMLLLSALLIASAVSTSHAAARIDERVLSVSLTAAHHVGTAAWLGAMPYLLISLGRVESVDEARRLTQHYSRMALLGANGAGIGRSGPGAAQAVSNSALLPVRCPWPGMQGGRELFSPLAD